LETSAQPTTGADEQFRQVYMNTMLTGTWPVVLTAVLLGLQGAIALVIALTIIVVGGISLARFQGAEILIGASIVALGIAALALPVLIWRRSLGPVLRSRRYLREKLPLASVEGTATWTRSGSSGPADTLTVGGRTFNMSMTTSYFAHGPLQDYQQHLRVWYVPTTGILVRAEARESA
jgi:hypothetical protein